VFREKKESAPSLQMDKTASEKYPLSVNVPKGNSTTA